MKDKKLSKPEKKFADAYLVNGFNATQAAKDAGYAEASARQQASKILKRPHVKKYIDDYMLEMQEEFKNKRLKAIEIQWDLAMQASGRKESTIVESAKYQGMVMFAEHTGLMIDHGAAATHFSNLAKMLGWNEEREDLVSSVNVFLGTKSKDNQAEREQRVKDHLKGEGVLK